jgi:hypothetical protein
MFLMRKIQSVLAMMLVVGLALSGIGMGVGLPTNPVAVAQEKTRDQALDGLWEDIENKGGWLRFEGSTIKYHPAGKSDEIIEWTCRYNLTPTPMTIDIFQKGGTAHGIFVFERGTLFIALGEKGTARPTSIQRGDRTTLLVLKRANPNADQGKDQKDVAAALKDYEKRYLKAINSKTDRGDDQKAILKWINSKAD